MSDNETGIRLTDATRGPLSDRPIGGFPLNFDRRDFSIDRASLRVARFSRCFLVRPSFSYFLFLFVNKPAAYIHSLKFMSLSSRGELIALISDD